MSYDTQISSLREIARDMRRLEKTEDLRNKRAAAEAEDKTANSNLVFFKKQLAAETYDLSKLDTAHPLFEDKKNELEESIKHLNETLKRAEETATNTKKAVEDLNKQITDVQSGEWKCNLEDLDSIVKESLIPAIIEAAAVKKAAEVTV